MGHPTESHTAPVPTATGPRDASPDDASPDVVGVAGAAGDEVRVSEPTTRVLPVIVPPTGKQGTPVAIPAPLNAPRPADAPTFVPSGPRRRLTKTVVLSVVGALAVIGVYVTAQWSLSERVPAGTSVAGVGVGNLDREEAVARLESQLGPRASAPVVIMAGDAATEVDPPYAGLAFDATATVDRLTGFSLNPLRLWAHLMGSDEASPAVAINRERLDAVASALAEYLYQPAADGTVGFVGYQPVYTPAADGALVTKEAVVEVLSTQWLLTEGPLEVPTQSVSPAVTELATADAFAQAQLIVSGPVTVEVGGQSAELPPDVLASVTGFEQVGGVLAPRFDGEALHAAVVERTTDLLSEPSDARFVFVEGRPHVEGGTAGTRLDAEALATAVQFAALGDERTAPVELTQDEPELTQTALGALGITEVVGSFSTGVTADVVRTNNLRRGAEILTGTLIRPGEQFSLLEALSPITAENGFGNAPVIVDGQFRPGMGGGLSQMATNVYNAAHFAGYQIDERHPHTVWIPRYPAGREATIFAGANAIDMRWTNNTPYGALLRSWVSGGQLHFQIWSSPYFRVETAQSGRSNVVRAEVRRGPASNCAPRSAGSDGFTVTNTRRVFRRDTNELVDEAVHTWSYRPDHGTYCYTPAPPPAAPAYGGGEGYYGEG